MKQLPEPLHHTIHQSQSSTPHNTTLFSWILFSRFIKIFWTFYKIWRCKKNAC